MGNPMRGRAKAGREAFLIHLRYIQSSITLAEEVKFRLK
jgi:hypothetical protein